MHLGGGTTGRTVELVILLISAKNDLTALTIENRLHSGKKKKLPHLSSSNAVDQTVILGQRWATGRNVSAVAVSV